MGAVVRRVGPAGFIDRPRVRLESELIGDGPLTLRLLNSLCPSFKNPLLPFNPVPGRGPPSLVCIRATSNSQFEPWSNNPNVPNIPYILYHFETALFARNLVGATPHGTPNRSSPTRPSIWAHGFVSSVHCKDIRRVRPSTAEVKVSYGDLYPTP